MQTILEISSLQFDVDLKLVVKSLEELQQLCNTSNSFTMGKPMSKFGWTFFQVRLKQDLLFGILKNFSDLIKKSKGRKEPEKLQSFMSNFFETRGCKIKLKITEDI